MSGARPVVLVVDDEPLNRAVVRANLSVHHEVLEAEDGRAALDLIRTRGDVSLVLLDVMMPGLDGFETCEAMKASAAGRYFPVLLLTALSDQESRNRGLAAGADDFLSKPIDRRELVLRVRAFIGLRNADALIRKQIEDLRNLQALKDDLFSLIVHDLRNPLAGVQGYLQIFRDALGGQGQAQLRKEVEAIIDTANKLRETLDDILEVRLLEEGELKLHREPVRLRAILEDAVATMQGAGLARQVAFELSLEADPTLSLDRKLIRRSIENVLANALKYTRRGEPISIAVRAEPGDAFAVDIADRGPGIPDELKDVLFRKFGSVEAKTGGVRRGFGLGLHLVKLAVTAHGGSVAVSDRPGGGSVFRLVLREPRGAAPLHPAPERERRSA